MLRALTAAHDIALEHCTNLVICMQLFEYVGCGSDLMHVAKQLTECAMSTTCPGGYLGFMGPCSRYFGKGKWSSRADLDGKSRVLFPCIQRLS